MCSDQIFILDETFYIRLRFLRNWEFFFWRERWEVEWEPFLRNDLSETLESLHLNEKREAELESLPNTKTKGNKTLKTLSLNTKTKDTTFKTFRLTNFLDGQQFENPRGFSKIWRETESIFWVWKNDRTN